MADTIHQNGWYERSKTQHDLCAGGRVIGFVHYLEKEKLWWGECKDERAPLSGTLDRAKAYVEAIQKTYNAQKFKSA